MPRSTNDYLMNVLRNTMGHNGNVVKGVIIGNKVGSCTVYLPYVVNTSTIKYAYGLFFVEIYIPTIL